MGRKSSDGLPCNRTLTNHAKDLGPEVKVEYFRRRENLKGEGLTPREAAVRAYTELGIADRWKDWHARKQLQKAMDQAVAVTPSEMEAAVPSYSRPTVTKAEEVGTQEMSQAEEVEWAMRWAARVQNGESAPTKFPNEGALFWFQSALSNRREFQSILVRVRSPSGDGTDPYLRQGQHQLREIEEQVKEAVRECGEKLVEMESGFAELLVDKVGTS